eukprot:12773432-Heterocapsa_arctica.AAC.1
MASFRAGSPFVILPSAVCSFASKSRNNVGLDVVSLALAISLRSVRFHSGNCNVVGQTPRVIFSIQIR